MHFDSTHLQEGGCPSAAPATERQLKNLLPRKQTKIPQSKVPSAFP